MAVWLNVGSVNENTSLSSDKYKVSGACANKWSMASRISSHFKSIEHSPPKWQLRIILPLRSTEGNKAAQHILNTLDPKQHPPTGKHLNESETWSEMDILQSSEIDWHYNVNVWIENTNIQGLGCVWGAAYPLVGVAVQHQLGESVSAAHVQKNDSRGSELAKVLRPVQTFWPGSNRHPKKYKYLFKNIFLIYILYIYSKIGLIFSLWKENNNCKSVIPEVCDK